MNFSKLMKTVLIGACMLLCTLFCSCQKDSSVLVGTRWYCKEIQATLVFNTNTSGEWLQPDDDEEIITSPFTYTVTGNAAKICATFPRREFDVEGIFNKSIMVFGGKALQWIFIKE